jgi:SAM-dependent methyltransferase
MSRFGSDPRAFFDFVYSDIPPWDIGGPQPALSALFSEFPPADPILDVGCGSGDLAIHLARLGHRVTGVDFVETAITQARQKAASLPVDVARLLNFKVADALQPTLLRKQFGSVMDSGFYHLLDPEPGQRFLDEVSSSLVPGGRYYLLAFAVDFSIPNLPRQVNEQELRDRFIPEKGWKILDLRPAEFLSRVAPPVAAVRACVERLPA